MSLLPDPDADLDFCHPAVGMSADAFLASMARFMLEGDERDEARLLLTCAVEMSYDHDDFRNEWLAIHFIGSRRAYDLLRDEGSTAREVFQNAARAVLPPAIDSFVITAGVQVMAPVQADWRNEFLAILDGKSVDNQAVGFKATKSYEGLRFRSESEVRIAQALDRTSVFYLPNCRGRVGSREAVRKNVEADFVVCAYGKWGVLEVDGGEWHPPERAAKEHQRDRPFKYHGAAVVERFDAGECFENADGVVRQFLTLLKGHHHD